MRVCRLVGTKPLPIDISDDEGWSDALVDNQPEKHQNEDQNRNNLDQPEREDEITTKTDERAPLVNQTGETVTLTFKLYIFSGQQDHKIVKSLT